MDKKWDVFICHSSNDKDSVVRDLANFLKGFGVKVWYDEFSLKLGDSLSQKIDEGLIHSTYGIIILSRSFLKKGWPDYEYRSLLSREINSQKIILPIWHDISIEEIRQFSPYLTDKLAFDTGKNDLEDIAKMLLEILRPDIYKNLNRLFQYQKLSKDAKRKTVAFSQIKTLGKKQRESLSTGEINRIKNIYYSIGQFIEPGLENWTTPFLYDSDPIREIQIWEILSASFGEYFEQTESNDHHIIKSVAAQLLWFSLGINEKIKGLPDEELRKLFNIYRNNFHTIS